METCRVGRNDRPPSNGLASNRLEWNTDSLAAQNTSNAQIEGDDPGADSLGDSVRLGNYCQISRKTVQISGTSQAVTAAGGTNKMSYQLLKASKSLKKDMEGTLTKNAAKAVGSASTARIAAGLPAYLISNTVHQTGGSPASGADPSDGTGAHIRTYNTTTAALTETQVKTLAQKMYSNSGESPEYLILSPTNKQIVSGFSGPGTRFGMVKDEVLRTAISVYETDFGLIKVIPDIFLAQTGDVYAIEPNFLEVSYLRPFQTVALAKTGDSDKKLLIVEYTLQVSNEKAIGGIFDTTG